MSEKDLERRQVAGVIGAGLIAALVAWLGVPSTAQAREPTGVGSSQVVAVTVARSARPRAT